MAIAFFSNLDVFLGLLLGVYIIKPIKLICGQIAISIHFEKKR